SLRSSLPIHIHTFLLQRRDHDDRGDGGPRCAHRLPEKLAGDGNADGNGGGLSRTLANVSDVPRAILKATKVQAFGRANPAPSVFEIAPSKRPEPLPAY